MFIRSDYLKFRLFLLIFVLLNVEANVTNPNVTTHNSTEPALIQEEPIIIVNKTIILPNSTVADIAKGFIDFLGVNFNEAQVPRLKELKSKLEKIDTYVIDKEKYGALILNEIKETNLTDLNFYNALKDDDEFDFLKKQDYKSLYLKLKERLNRDDVMNMLIDSNKSEKVQQIAEDSPDGDLNVLVDKILGEPPKDKHKYNMSSIQSIYWDPEPEIRLYRDEYRDGRRLYRGEATTIRDYPFMAAVHVMGSFWCGGAIYWSDLIITSAACMQLIHSNRFFRENARVVHVRVGSNHSLTNGEMIEAQEVYFHPSYNPSTLRNNIAIIRLTRLIHFSSHTVPKAIQISHKEHNVPITEKVTLLGWGANNAGGKMPYTPMFLKRLVLPVYPNWYCKEVYGDKFIAGQMFCAGTQTTGEGACDHDAGGPAIIDGQLYGIISFGPSVCGYRDAPTVFTHIGTFSDWIETINETMPKNARILVPTTTTTPLPLIHSTQETGAPESGEEVNPEATTEISTLQSEARQRLVRILPVTKKLPPRTIRTRGFGGTTDYKPGVKLIPAPPLPSARKQAQLDDASPTARGTKFSLKKT